MSSAPLIITCGNNEKDAVGVHKGMQPDYNGTQDDSLTEPPTDILAVIYAGFELSATRQELPKLLAGETIDQTSLHTHVASNDFQHPPNAIVMGGGYDDAAVEQLTKAIADAHQHAGKKLSFAYFRADNALTDRLVAEGKGPQKRTPEYTIAITKRLEDKLATALGSEEVRQREGGETILY